jgi:molecular chaperone GrpE
MTEKRTVPVSDDLPDDAGRDAPVDNASSGTEDLAAKCASLEKDRDELKDKLQRAQAECANISKRLHQQHADSLKLAEMDVVRSILPVLDNLDRILPIVTGAGVEPAVADGIKLIANELNQALRSHGVLPIEALAKPFNPSMHEALMQDRDSELPPGTVSQELQRGYTMHGRVVRPARVAVVAEKTEDESPKAE